jgi:hypothetical protein
MAREPSRDSEWAVGTSGWLDDRLKGLQDVRMGHELTAAGPGLEWANEATNDNCDLERGPGKTNVTSGP